MIRILYLQEVSDFQRMQYPFFMAVKSLILGLNINNSSDCLVVDEQKGDDILIALKIKNGNKTGYQE